jgi:hypothetical protein
MRKPTANLPIFGFCAISSTLERRQRQSRSGLLAYVILTQSVQNVNAKTKARVRSPQRPPERFRFTESQRRVALN